MILAQPVWRLPGDGRWRDENQLMVRPWMPIQQSRLLVKGIEEGTSGMAGNTASVLLGGGMMR